MKIILPLFLILGIFAFTNCSSSEKGTDKMKIQEAPPPLSPGTAAVEAEVVSISETNGVTMCKIKILKVLEYGSSTRSIGENSELETKLSKTLSKGSIEDGKVYKLLLRNNSPKGEESNNSGWQISKIYK